METLSSKELARILLLKDVYSLGYYGRNRKGNFPKPIKIKNESHYKITEINKMLGIKNIKDIEFIDKNECMQILGLSPKKARSLLNSKKIPSYRISNYKGARMLFDKAQIERIKNLTEGVEVSFSFSSITLDNILLTGFIKKLLGSKPFIPNLSEKELDILKYLFFEKLSLRKVAKKYNVTTERIRQIKDKTQRKIRYNIDKLSLRYRICNEKILEVEYLKEKNERLEMYIKKFKDGEKKLKESKEYENIYGCKLSDLKLSTRSYYNLRGAGLETSMDVINYCETYGYKSLLRIRNFGVKSSSEVLAVFLKKFNIDLMTSLKTQK
ncbi:MAG: hypothetical protein FVQ77_07120 [Cytophagales bacterium]|nr:hypothetical protein [Cytophagales bacterium]